MPPFEVGGFWTLVGGALLVWAVNMLVNVVVEPEERIGQLRRAFR